MKFKMNSVEVNNFFGYKEAKFTDIKDYNVLIGKNNAGKSNLFRIFNLLIRNYNDGQFDKSYLFDCKTNTSAEIKIEFNLGKDYRRELFNRLYETNYFTNSFHPSHKNFDDSPKKWGENTLDWLIENEYFKSIIVNFSYQPNLDGLILKSIIATNKKSITRIFDTIYKDKHIFLEFLERDGRTGAKSLKSFFERSYTKLEISFSPYTRSLKSFQNQFISNDYNFSQNLPVSNFIPFFNIYNDIIFPFFESFHYFPYNRHFEKSNDISELEDEIPLANGTNISKFLANMKMNNPTWLEELNNEIKEFFTEMIEFTSKTESNQTIFHLKEKGLDEILRLENVGIGLLNIVNFLINLKYYDMEKYFFLIEEPELFIYPGLQKMVRDKLIKFANKNQVFITTHSPNFLTRDFERSSIFHVKKRDNYSIVNNLSDENLLEVFKELELSFYDYILYDGILFVEGPKDTIVFNILINEMFEKSLKIIPTEGKNNFVHYASANIIHFLDNNSFSFLFILDRDRGNENFYKRIKKQEDRELIQERIIILYTYEIENIFLQQFLILDYLYTNQKIDNFSEDCEWLFVTLENIFQLLGNNNFEYLLKKINDYIAPKLSNSEIEDLLGKSDKFTSSSEVFDFWYETINEILKKKLKFLKIPTLDRQFFLEELKNHQERYEEFYIQKNYNLIISGKKVIKILSKKIIEKFKLSELTIEILTRNLVYFLLDFNKYLGKFSYGDKPANTMEFQTIIKIKEKEHNLLSCINVKNLSKLSDYISNFMVLLDNISRKMESKVKIKFTLSKTDGLQYLSSFLSLRWNLNELL